MHVFSGDDRQRDVFPLPLAPVPRLSRRGLSRGVRQRLGKERAIESQLAAAVASLNEMYGSPSQRGLVSAVQTEALDGIKRRLECCVWPSNLLSPREAAAALLGTDLGYDGAEDHKQLALYRRGAVSLPLGHAPPSALTSVLDPEARLLVDEFEQRLLLSPDEYDAVFRDPPRIVPYMDPVLASKPDEYHNFIGDLYRCHVIGFTQHPKGKATPFCQQTGKGANQTGH